MTLYMDATLNHHQTKNVKLKELFNFSSKLIIGKELTPMPFLRLTINLRMYLKRYNNRHYYQLSI